MNTSCRISKKKKERKKQTNKQTNKQKNGLSLGRLGLVEKIRVAII